MPTWIDRLGRQLILAIGLLAFPAAGYAQEAAITGTVTDATGGVLPGVTVTAIHESTGNRFTTVTDERGTYRVPARVGSYAVTVELQGFTTMTRSGIQLLVGQTATLNLQMSPSTVQETITVTADAPLLNVTSSTIGSNIDPRQMSELPVQGRDWTSLALVAPGNRTTAMGSVPVQDRGDVREFQLNMDGQQVTSNLGPGGQPRFSRDAIAEFQFISNRFDATQGRSSGVQVNAITRSGTNTLAGSFAGYFRNAEWGAVDPVLEIRVPLENQQYSTTVGGPVLRDRLHFFGSYEYDRLPQTTIANTAFPSFNIELTGTTTTHLSTARVDYQLSPQNRLMVKGNLTTYSSPFTQLGSDHPAGSGSSTNETTNLQVQLTQVFGNRALNEIKVGYAGYGFTEENLTTWSDHPLASRGITNGHPRIQFTGFNITGNNNWPRYWFQDVYNLRDDFQFSYDAKGRHDLKAGGEFIWDKKISANCTSCMGRIDARGGPLPSVAQMQAWFPDSFNVDTWNLNAIANITRRYVVGISDAFPVSFNQPKYGAWAQDDWRIGNRLTVNLGLRYDLIWDAFNQQVEFLPWMVGGRPQDADNIQPRLGAAYQINERTVLRGGAGLYYTDIIASAWTHSTRSNTTVFLAVDNDGRPDFVTNPFNGPAPTYEQAIQRVCDVNTAAFESWRARNYAGTAPCLFRDFEELAPPAHLAALTNSWQSSFGVQRQIGGDMAIEIDYVNNRSRDEKILHDQVNLAYDPATGINYPYAANGPNRALLPYPEFGLVGYYAFNGRSDYHGLQTVWTKRFSNRWQASINYLLSRIKNDDPAQPMSGLDVVPFPVAADMGGEYGLAETDQRHRAVFNGIWQVGYGFQVSGLYFFGSGERQANICGGDRRGWSRGGTQRLCTDGTILERNSFARESIHRVDMRLQQRVPLVGGVQVDGIFEMFNIFDRANYGSYTIDRSSPRYGLPNASTNLAFAPRTLQLGFRVTF
jgi:hypothetical protein